MGVRIARRQWQGPLLFCAYCRRIPDEDDQSGRDQVETRIAEHLDVHVSRGNCPSYLESVMKTDEQGISEAYGATRA